MTYKSGFDHFGLESPFASNALSASAYEAGSSSAEGEQAAPSRGSPLSWLSPAAGAVVANAAATNADDPPKLAEMLAIRGKTRGRFDDPKRDRAVEMDGTRFSAFLSGRSRRDFVTMWLSSHPALEIAARAPEAKLGPGDIAKAWFVIHDVGASGSIADGDHYKTADPRWKNKKSVHGYLNWSGSYAVIQDFDKRAQGTVFEFLSTEGRKICDKKTINIETVPDIEKFKPNQDGSLPPPSSAERYASIGYRALPKGDVANDKFKRTHAYYKWTRESFDTLADLYILASARAGHLLTITAHKEMDRNLARSVIWQERSARELINAGPKQNCRVRPTSSDPPLARARDCPSNPHGDPYAFNMQALYDVITGKLNALGGSQMPAGARYGIHPLRLRRADGRDIMNGDDQLHEFPHQSDPVVKKDGKLKKDQWWIGGSAGESSDEAPWSQAEWSAISSAEADGADEWQSTDTEEVSLFPCGQNQERTGDGLDEEQLAWLEPQREDVGACPHCGRREAALEEGWHDSESDFEADAGFDALPQLLAGSGAASPASWEEHAPALETFEDGESSEAQELHADGQEEHIPALFDGAESGLDNDKLTQVGLDGTALEADVPFGRNEDTLLEAALNAGVEGLAELGRVELENSAAQPTLKLDGFVARKDVAQFAPLGAAAYKAATCVAFTSPAMLFTIRGRLQVTESGLTRPFKKEDRKTFPRLSAVIRARPVNGVSASSGLVVPLKDDGSFDAPVHVVLQQGTWRLSFQVTVEWRGGKIAADATVTGSDLACFVQLVEPHENARLAGQNRFEFLAAVRKMYQPSPDSSLASLFPRVLDKTQKVQPLFAPNSTGGIAYRRYEQGMKIRGEDVDIGHVLVAIEAYRRQGPGASGMPVAWGPAQIETLMTWGGDLGGVLAYVARQKPLLKATAADIPRLLAGKASFADLRGDLDGLNIGAVYDPSSSLAANLTAYYDSPSFRRFHAFVSNALDDAGKPMFGLSAGKPARIDGAGANVVAKWIEYFARAYLVFNGFFSMSDSEVRVALAAIAPGSKESTAIVSYFIDFLNRGLASEP